MTAPIVATLPTAAAAVRAEPAYKRVLLKLSGEALMGDDPYGINREVIDRIVAEIGEIVRLGVQVAVVIGGGNIFRGVAPGAAGMDRATADYMGMLATLMNALALQDAMRRAGLVSRVQSALSLCRDQNMLLKVFSIFVPGALKRVVMGGDEGTLVHC